MAWCAGSHKTARDADGSVRVGIASSGGMLLDAEARRRGDDKGCAARLTLGWKADNRSPRRLPQSGLVHYLELAALHKIIEEGRVRFQAAVFHPRHQFLQFPAPGPRKQSDAGAFNRSVAHLYDPRVGQIGNEPDAARRVHLQVAAEAAGQIEHLDLVEA